MALKNIKQFADTLQDLERIIEIGAVDPSVMFKIDKFSRSVLANGVVSLLSSFNNVSPFLDTPTELFIASDNALDTFDVTIYYIEQTTRLSKTVVVTLTGTTPISLGIDKYCIWRMENHSATDHVGIITITSNATGVPLNDTEVYCEMIIINGVPNNQSLTGIFSIPAGFSGFLTRASIQADKSADVKGAMFIRQSGEVFRFVKALAAFQNTSDYKDLFQRIPEKTDIKPYGLAQTGGIIFTEYTIVCISNDYLNKHIY